MTYGVSTRMKRVSEPLDDKAKARIIGCNRIIREPTYAASSGSEHSADHHSESDVVFSSPSFSDLFLNDSREAFPESDESDTEHGPSADHDSTGAANIDLIKQIVENQQRDDEYRETLIAHVSNAVLLFSCVEPNKQILMRNVMSFLRECGYNAAICKTKWKSSHGLTAGNYQFIDVVHNSTRYFVDLDLASELEIARPTSCYDRLLEHIPRVFVGKIEYLKKILNIASGAAMRSMKSRGIPLPPWRKYRFMKNKWFGPYRRTTNLYPTEKQQNSYGGAAVCRTVGFEFDARVSGGSLLIPKSARTR